MMRGRWMVFAAVVLAVALSLSSVASVRAASGAFGGVGANVYGRVWSEDDCQFAASHFGLLVMDLEGERRDFTIAYGAAAARMKQLNPSMKILGYKDAVYLHTYDADFVEANSHEDWFVHDTKGARVTNNYWSAGTVMINGVGVYDTVYLMDVGSAGWRSHYVSSVNARLSSFAGYDGVFMDDVWSQIFNMMQTPTTFAGYTLSSDTINGWYSDMLGMVQAVKSGLSGKLVMVNTDAGWGWDILNNRLTSRELLDASDGHQIEGYFSAPWEDQPRLIPSMLSCLAESSRQGKLVFASSGCVSNSEDVLDWTYSMFMLGAGPSAFYGWSSENNDALSNRYRPLFDVALGAAEGNYYSSEGVYVRDFSGGRVFANPSGLEKTLLLSSALNTVDGVSVSRVELDAYGGVLLLDPDFVPVVSPSSVPVSGGGGGGGFVFPSASGSPIVQVNTGEAGLPSLSLFGLDSGASYGLVVFGLFCVYYFNGSSFGLSKGRGKSYGGSRKYRRKR